MRHDNVEMRVVFDSPPDSGAGDAILVTGGIQISINGKPLTSIETSSNTRGEDCSRKFNKSREELEVQNSLYQGHYIGPLLVSLAENLLEIAQKGNNRFQERQVDLGQDAGDGILILSYLDGSYIRIAFQNRYGRSEHGPPTVEQTMGNTVKFKQFVKETIRCSRTFLEYAESTGCRDTSVADDLAELIGQ